MFGIKLIIESKVDLNALSECVDMIEADKHSSEPAEKLSVVAQSIFSLDVSKNWIHLTFYVRLPTEVIEILNTAPLKVLTRDNRGVSGGFVSGTLSEFITFVTMYSQDNFPASIRLIANQFYIVLKEKYNVLRDRAVHMLTDKTFTLK